MGKVKRTTKKQREEETLFNDIKYHKNNVKNKKIKNKKKEKRR